MLKPKSIFLGYYFWPMFGLKLLNVFNYIQFDEMEVNDVNDVSILPLVALKKITRGYLCFCVDRRGYHGKEAVHLMN